MPPKNTPHKGRYHKVNDFKRKIKEGAASSDDEDGAFSDSSYSDEQPAYKKRQLKKELGLTKSQQIKADRKHLEKIEREVERELPTTIAPPFQPNGLSLDAKTLPKLTIYSTQGLPHPLHVLLAPTERVTDAFANEELAKFPVVLRCTATNKYFLLPIWWVKQHYTNLDTLISDLRSLVLKEYPVPTGALPTVNVERLIERPDSTVQTVIVNEIHPAFINLKPLEIEEWKKQQFLIYNQMVTDLVLEREAALRKQYREFDSTTVPIEVLQECSETQFQPSNITPQILAQYNINANDLITILADKTSLLNANSNLIDINTWSHQGYEESDIEEGELLDSFLFQTIEPFSYPQLGFIDFTRLEYENLYAHPNWTLYETLALFEFVTKNQPDSFLLAREDPLLSARHTWEQCLERWLSICAIASMSSQLTTQDHLQLLFNNTDRILTDTNFNMLYEAWDQTQPFESETPFFVKKQQYFTTTRLYDLLKPIDYSVDVPVILPIDYEPTKIQQECTIGIIPYSQPVNNMDEELKKQYESVQQQIEVDPNLQFFNNKFGIPIHNIDVPADLQSQLLPAQHNNAYINDELQYVREKYSQGFKNQFDQGEIELQTMGFTSSLQKGATSSPSAVKKSPFGGNGNRAKYDDDDDDDDDDDHGGDDDDEDDDEDGDDSDAPRRPRRRMMETRRSSRKPTADDEDNHADNEGASGREDANDANNEADGDDDDDDDEDDEDDDDDEDDEEYEQRQQNQLQQVLGKIDRLLDHKIVKKRIVFKLNKHVLTPALCEKLVEAEKADFAAKGVDAPHAQEEILPSDEELQEIANHAYYDLLYTIVKEEYQDFDDFSIMGRHPEFYDEFGYYDDSDDVDSDTGRKLKDVIAEKAQCEEKGIPYVPRPTEAKMVEIRAQTAEKAAIAASKAELLALSNSMNDEDDLVDQIDPRLVFPVSPLNPLHPLNPTNAEEFTAVFKPFFKTPLPADAIVAYYDTTVYLIKEISSAFINSRWMSREQMLKRFGLKSTVDRIKRHHEKYEDIQFENQDKYGGALYEPRYNEVDRIVSFAPKIFTIQQLIHMLPPGFTEFEKLDLKPIPPYALFKYVHPDPQRPDLTTVEFYKQWDKQEFDLHLATHQASPLPPDIEEPEDHYRFATPCYLVKWCQLGYGAATWELKYLMRDHETEIAQFNRFNKRPNPQQLASRHYNADQLRERNERKNQWHDSSPQYKGGNTLRQYQVQGINWLIKCYIDGKNGILADEMGLGKTVQCIAFLEHLRREENMRGPYLIVAPLSTLSNWISEANTWTDMNTILYHDPTTGAAGRELLRQYEFFYPGTNICKFNNLITSYEMLLQDQVHLKRCGFKYVIIDEGHRLKNKTAKLMDAFQHLDISRRLLLTGTPIQNNTTELWTLLNFLEPTKFNDEKAFKKQFGSIAGAAQAELLQQTINPYILRRMKETVEQSIPRKAEHIVNVELTRIQKLYYRAVYERNIGFLRTGPSISNAPKLINVETELRKVCNHPWLVVGAQDQQAKEFYLSRLQNQVAKKMISEEQEKTEADAVNTTFASNPGAIQTYLSEDDRMLLTIQSSGKLAFLEKLLPQLILQNERVLIFSQMVTMLDILSDYLRFRGYKHERLDGSVTGDQRTAAIDRFCRPDSDRFVFLLSTRAGGVGLNLTSANVVIIFDSDWNPQQDIQAQARAHRIGQKQDVRIYRLITRNTYESQMFARASLKLGLDHAILKKLEVNDKGQATYAKKRGKNGLSAEREDIDRILREGAYGILDDDQDHERNRFFEGDIETILKNNTYTINNAVEKKEGATEAVTFDGGLADQQRRHQQIVEQKKADRALAQKQSGLGVSANKVYFAADKDTLAFDMNDGQFWTKILSAGSSDYKYTQDALLSRLTAKKGGPLFATEEDKQTYLLDLEEGFNRVLKGRQESRLEIHDVDEFISLLDTVTAYESVFDDVCRAKCTEWTAELEKLTARRGAGGDKSQKYALYDDSSDYDEDNDEDDDDEDAEDDTEEASTSMASTTTTTTTSTTSSSRRSRANNNDTNDDEGGGRNSRSARSAPKKRYGYDDDSSDYEDPSKPKPQKAATHNKPGTREPTEEDIETLNDENILVIKEKGGINNDIYITIIRRGKGARPLQHNFVCDICLCPGDLVACDGPCSRLFHRECIPRGAPKLGTLPSRVDTTFFTPPAPPAADDFDCPRSLEQANELLNNFGKPPLLDDGKDYVLGPQGAYKLYYPTKDEDRLQTTKWECAECVCQSWRCTFCLYPVYAGGPRKSTKRNNNTKDKDGDKDGDKEDDGEDVPIATPAVPLTTTTTATTITTAPTTNPAPNAVSSSTLYKRRKFNQDQETAAKEEVQEAKKFFPDKDIFDPRHYITYDGSDPHDPTPDAKDLQLYNRAFNTIPLREYESASRLCHQALCGKVAHFACILANPNHIRREAASGNPTPERFKNFRCPQHACEPCSISGADCDVPKRRGKAAAGSKDDKDDKDEDESKDTESKDMGATSKDDDKAADDKAVDDKAVDDEFGPQERTTIEHFDAERDIEGNILPFIPGTAATEIKSKSNPQQQIEGLTTTIEITVHDDGSITKKTIVNDKGVSRQKAMALNTVFPCVSCGNGMHNKCFPKDTSEFAKLSKRQVLCRACTSKAVTTAFGQRVLQLAEWSYSIPLRKDRVTIPMHAGPKRGDAPPPTRGSRGGRGGRGGSARNSTRPAVDDEEDENADSLYEVDEEVATKEAPTKAKRGPASKKGPSKRKAAPAESSDSDTIASSKPTNKKSKKSKNSAE